MAQKKKIILWKQFLPFFATAIALITILCNNSWVGCVIDTRMLRRQLFLAQVFVSSFQECSIDSEKSRTGRQIRKVFCQCQSQDESQKVPVKSAARQKKKKNFSFVKDKRNSQWNSKSDSKHWANSHFHRSLFTAQRNCLQIFCRGYYRRWKFCGRQKMQKQKD